MRSRSAAQMHALVNDLVIETLSEGVLVVDAQGLVHAANPAADAILGQGLADIPLPFALERQPGLGAPWPALARQTFRAAQAPVARKFRSRRRRARPARCACARG